MEPFDINAVLGFAIGYLVAQFLRYLSRTRFWSSVRARAQRILQDPAVPVDDPQRATELALVDAQRERVEREARKLTPSTPPPFGGGDNT